eukprot:gnl/TRDRNA2_/TRDRNA2_172030_c9_seq3.p1 gnl/TRDRNA2_/TRDRNA2_172030_c9~~gnl/TRDRNA2_/TRDRNA2_172030_c9_seq3.p1  ORF type:complete len:285 (+),score=68.86 gnl/TRDRNA2_/TRDRNA2_172030_c9_seq3:52-855(+)
MDMFGTVEAALFTLYRINTSGSYWGDEFKLIHMTGIGYTSFYIFYVGFFQFAVFNILTALFVEHAMKLAKPDERTLIFEERRQELADIEEMKLFCGEMDENGSGFINLQELKECLKNEKAKAYLTLQGIDVQDAETFFSMLADETESERVEIDAFAEGALKMKGMANAMDMQTVLYKMKVAQQQDAQFAKHMETRLDIMSQQLTAATQQITSQLGFRSMADRVQTTALKVPAASDMPPPRDPFQPEDALSKDGQLPVGPRQGSVVTI